MPSTEPSRAPSPPKPPLSKSLPESLQRPLSPPRGPDREPDNAPSDPAAGNRQQAEPVDWQTAMKRAVRTRADLLRRLGLSDSADDHAEDDFPTFVPLELVDRIVPGRADDPVLRQVLASAEELREQPGFVADPVGDLQADLGGGALHKYEGRVLIVTHGACAVHCRYCFRREFPYTTNGGRKQLWQPALERIADDPSVQEVLLSGGDPLTLTDDVLDDLIGRIEAIPHVRRLRIHTRLPIVIPQRVTETLVERLSNSPLAVWLVVHCNHAQEIDGRVADALEGLRRGGIALLNQAVLLRGVNDDVETLAQLSEKLVDLNVLPYYLHQLDRVRGASHFWVDVERGKEIVEALRARLPGYAVPKFVVELAGEKSKTPIA